MSKKVCFMFLTYGDPLNYWKTWFPSEQSYHVIIIHNKYPLSTFWQNYALPKEYIVQTSWGAPSIVKATLSMLRFAASKNCSHYILLSDSCVPLYNFGTTLKCIKSLKLSNINEKKTIRRNGQLYKTQCQWCIFNHEDAIQLINNENFQAYKSIKILDEVYFVNEVKQYTKKPLTYVNWIDKHRDQLGYHPKLWKQISVRDINYIRSTGALFMRKCTNETNFRIFLTPQIFFGEAEKQIFRKMKQTSRNKKIHKHIDIILKCSIQNVLEVCNKNKEVYKSDKSIWQIWNTLSQVITKGAHNYQILF